MKLWIEGCHQRLCWGYDLLASLLWLEGSGRIELAYPFRPPAHTVLHIEAVPAGRQAERERDREPWRIFEPHGVQITMLNHCQVAAISLSLISAAFESNHALWQWKFPLNVRLQSRYAEMNSSIFKPGHRHFLDFNCRSVKIAKLMLGPHLQHGMKFPRETSNLGEKVASCAPKFNQIDRAGGFETPIFA